jgi:hypothetical protein
LLSHLCTPRQITTYRPRATKHNEDHPLLKQTPQQHTKLNSSPPLQPRAGSLSHVPSSINYAYTDTLGILSIHRTRYLRDTSRNTPPAHKGAPLPIPTLAGCWGRRGFEEHRTFTPQWKKPSKDGASPTGPQPWRRRAAPFWCVLDATMSGDPGVNT